MKVTIYASPTNKKTILDLAEEQGISLPCNCHGANACGGRLYDFPCGMIPNHDMTVSIPERTILKEINGISLEVSLSQGMSANCILIDLGTTTVSMIFYNTDTHTTLHSTTFPNPQRTYGTDVISRIKYDVEFHTDYTLKKRICDEITNQFEIFHSSHPDLKIETCLIGGNTTMIHLLLGFPLDGMTGAPFTPYPAKQWRYHYKDTEIVILPWLSAFIGGDITAGLLCLDFDRRLDTCLLADLGTNGELALLHQGILYTASTAAGPAFEGGGLSCGCPAISGAIADFEWNRIMPKLKTIQNKLPIGICGSGAISILSELIRCGLLQENGTLAETFPTDGLPICNTATKNPIIFTAKDVRQMQLAVAAIGAGIDTLCIKAGISTQHINSVYLAGSFGHHISIKKAIVTGLFSDVGISRIFPAGNTCLRGLAAIAGNRSELSERTDCLKSMCHETDLAGNDYFEQRFIQHMTYKSISTL